MKIKILMKYFLIISLAPCLAIALPSTYLRFPLNQFSTEKKPFYFNCTISPNNNYPTTRKFDADSIRVIMVNYAQMIRQFNGLGMLEATARYINTYAFATYHDPRPFYRNQPGFVDIFVTWPSYQVTCKNGLGGRPLTPVYG